MRLQRVADFAQPIATRHRPGDDVDAVHVAERRGLVVRLDRSTGARSTVVDIEGLTTTGSERGLLSFDFSPDGDTLYLAHTDADGDVQVAEYGMSGDTALGATRRLVLEIDQPFANHNGGDLHVTDDGILWLSSGDGGSGGDPDSNAQDTTNLLGAIVRIDPTPGPGTAYSIPPDNPFVGQPGFRGELWAYGLRNPWRFSFDATTGDLWIGDVGQGAFEEIDYEPAGQGGRNYGWRRFEGNSLFSPTTPAPGAVGPIHVYGHDQGCSVTGGLVYRGTAIEALVGAYLFADFCSGTIWELRHDDGADVEVGELDVEAAQIVDFAVDGSGEVLVTSLRGTVFELVPG